MKKPIVLRIYQGEQLLGVKQFVESQIVIGRQGEAQVLLDSDKVSVIHAVIEEREGGGYYICDLGSETGTLRNGEKILDTEIVTGDVIQIGDFKLEFYIGVPKPKAPPQAVATSSAVPKAETTQPASEAAAATTPVSPPAPADLEPTAPPAAAPVATTFSIQGTSVAETRAPSAPKTEAPLFEPVAIQAGSAASKNIEKAKDSPAIPVTTSPVKAKAPPPVQAARTSASASGGALEQVKSRKQRWGRTFAPASRFGSVTEYVRPSKGTVVEILVAWRERVIASYHFTGKRVVTMGSHPDNDIVLPPFSSKVRRTPILRLDSSATALISAQMTGELIRGQASSSFIELVRQNRMAKAGSAYTLALEQGEMLKIDLSDQVSLIVRYVSDSPKPLMAPFLDLTTSEFTGVVLSVVLVLILGLYMFIYMPPKPLPDDGLANEPIRTAIIIVKPTPPPPLPPPVKVEAKVEPTPAATPPPPMVKATPQPQKVEEKKVITAPKAVTNLTKKKDPGLSANAAPTKNKTGPRQLTSPKQGGAIKTAAKEGSQMKSQQKDISKSGVFSVLGGGGAQDQLSQNTQGAGELAGLANAATGRAGSAANRPGKGLGSELKDTGVGGNGKALEGIAGGISTSGRGSGNSGYGAGGLGAHTGVKITSGGTEESFSGTIDREAIRRVIQANLRVIRSCYERELNRHPELSGKIVIGWEIGEQGRVVSAKVNSNELGSAEVGQCIVERLRTWRFPEPPSNQVVEVAYPFFFSN